MQWIKKGLIISPNPELYWMSHGAGPSFARIKERGLLEIFVTGRDEQNRSRIGRIIYNLNDGKIEHADAHPLFDLGELGAFDFNGTSYPWYIETEGESRIYYTGWTKGYHVSFINDLGMVLSKETHPGYQRISRAPLIPRTHEEPFGTGSVCVLKEEEEWKMWYTCFKKWGTEEEPGKHFYHIKFANSADGIHWNRPDVVSVDYNESNGEYVTAKPSVIKYRGKYLMWFSYRGETYRLGLAVSDDGKNFTRIDGKVGITVSENGWDSEMICYGQIFFYEDHLYMIYNGNGYGRSGLGLATLPVSELDALINEL